MSNRTLHPASLILIWLAFAFSVPWLRPVEMGVIVGLLSLFNLLWIPGQYLRILRRSRWLLLSMMLVYAFITPGDAVFPGLIPYSPTLQGMQGGIVQALRLIVVLATLVLMLATMSQNQLLAGLYLLLRPFSSMGLNVDRCAARIWLTLQYSEQVEHERSGKWQEQLHSVLSETGYKVQEIELELGRLGRLDCLLVSCAGVAMGMLLVRGIQ